MRARPNKFKNLSDFFLRSSPSRERRGGLPVRIFVRRTEVWWLCINFAGRGRRGAK